MRLKRKSLALSCLYYIYTNNNIICATVDQFLYHFMITRHCNNRVIYFSDLCYI